MTYHIAIDGQQKGPYTLDELWTVDFAPDSLVWREGMADWQRADAVPDLRVILAGKVPPEPVPESEPEPDVFEVKIPDEPQRVQPVTVYPGTFPAPGPAHPGSALQYAGAYSQGVLPTGAAVTSMVLGITALVLSFLSICLWFLSGPLAIAAIIVGHIAHGGARRGVSGGGGMALAGLICGYFALALTGFFMIAFFSAALGA
jgi:hypothetical protein